MFRAGDTPGVVGSLLAPFGCGDFGGCCVCVVDVDVDSVMFWSVDVVSCAVVSESGFGGGDKEQDRRISPMDDFLPAKLFL